MATIYDKKKLLDENKDLYMSEHDRGLGYEAISGIIQAKREYALAEKNNDSAGMKKANAKANSIRSVSGSYTGGDDGSEYNPIIRDYEKRPSTGYKSSYESRKNKALTNVLNYEDFTYDPEADPLFQTYRKLYTRLGNDAYERALAQNSLRTGGVINTSASSAAMQALGKYNSMITDKIPELYEAAYKKYADGYERLYKNLELLSDLEDREYSRYRDDMKDFEADRDYYYTKHRDSAEDALDMYRFDTNTSFSIDKENYDRSRDEIEDSKWSQELESENESKRLRELTRVIQSLYGKKLYNSDASIFLELMKKLYN